jgi:hypothetical protein
MPEITGSETSFKGPYGRAASVPLPDVPDAAESLCTWLLTAPKYHPVWTQYLMPVVRLRDIDGFPPPKRQFPGATHELIVVALDPEHGPYTAESLLRYMTGEEAGGLPYLTPANIAHQVEGTDEEISHLAAYAAWGVTAGMLNPETGDAPGYIREGWKVSLVRTLAHIRDEAHAS